VLLVLGCPAFFTYAVKYSLKADLFIAACLLFLTGAYRLVRQPPRAGPRRYEAPGRELQIATIFGVIGIVGSALLLVDGYLSGLEISLTFLLDNLSQLRTDTIDKAADAFNRGAIGTLGGLAAPCGVLCILAAVKLGRDGSRTLRRLAVANYLLIIPVALAVFTGRAALVNVSVLIVISLYLSRERLVRLTPRSVAIASVALISVWFLSTTWIERRQGGVDAIDTLEKTQRATPAPWLNTLSQVNPSIATATVSFAYFASPMPTFHFYVESPPLPGPYYGAYSFPQPARFVGTLAGTWTRDQWSRMRQEIYTPINKQGYFDNVWATWPRDLLVDFGYLGSLGFCALFGAFMAWARNQSQRTNAVHYHCFEVLACFVLGFGAFTSFMWDAFIGQAFFLAFVFMFAVRAEWQHSARGVRATKRVGNKPLDA
jgi:hypothetical protein